MLSSPESTRPESRLRAGLDGARHLGDHKPLLRYIVPTHAVSAPPLDAVVVPAARPAGQVRTAAAIARRTGARLVVLASRGCRAEEAAAVAVRSRVPAAHVVVVDVVGDTAASLPRFAASRIDTGETQLCADGVTGRRDTALKRNIGLRLARLTGWRTVLFVDDDVSGITPIGLARARHALAEPGGPGAVAWAFEDYPDNSVVCHAHRAGDGRQSTFVGAGGLLVRVDGQVPHFPSVYNEDWLFFAELMQRRRRGLGFGGTLQQRAFDPFTDPDAARRQEFGDVLGEGLFALFHARKRLGTATSSGYWTDYLHVRRRFLADICARLTAGHGRLGDQSRGRAVACLEAAQQTLQSGWSQWQLDLPAFVEAWRQDAATWRCMMSRQGEAVLSVDDALAELGLVRVDTGGHSRVSRLRRVELPGPQPAPTGSQRGRLNMISARLGQLWSAAGARASNPVARGQRTEAVSTGAVTAQTIERPAALAASKNVS